jgi:hypothetical protein
MSTAELGTAPDETPDDEEPLVQIGVHRARAAFTRGFVTNDGVHVQLDIRVLAGRPRVAAVRFNPLLDADDVAKVDYVGMVAMALLEEFHRAFDEDRDEWTTLTIDDLHNLARRNNRWSPSVAQDVAEWYDKGGASLVAAQMHVSRRQADRYIARARREGAL